MSYSVYLVITPPEKEHLERLEEVLREAPFHVDIEWRPDGNLGIWCKGITSTGNAPLPEALRLAQVGLSIPLKHAYPVYATRGGLLWADVVTAEILTVH